MKTCHLNRYAVIFALFFIGCQDNYASVSFMKVESEHTKLINGIESYQSIEEFRKFLDRSTLIWKVSQDSKPSPKGRPPFNISTITIKNYLHLGFSGDLEISFFNNRLAATTFYPSDVGKYIVALATEGIKFDTNHEAKLSPHTRVRSAVNYKGQKYVDWSDIRLDKEVELWIKRYS